MNFFLVTSSNYKASLFSYESSMLLNRWIDHDDSFCTSLTCFVTFDFFLSKSFFFFFSLLFFSLLFLLISLCTTFQAFERVVQNEEFNLKIKFFFCPCRGSFLSFSFLITLLISLHSWMYSVKWLVRCIYWKIIRGLSTSLKKAPFKIKMLLNFN